jgi:hypothetical protein
VNLPERRALFDKILALDGVRDERGKLVAAKVLRAVRHRPELRRVENYYTGEGVSGAQVDALLTRYLINLCHHMETKRLAEMCRQPSPRARSQRKRSRKPPPAASTPRTRRATRGAATLRGDPSLHSSRGASAAVAVADACTQTTCCLLLLETRVRRGRSAAAAAAAAAGAADGAAAAAGAAAAGADAPRAS